MGVYEDTDRGLFTAPEPVVSYAVPEQATSRGGRVFSGAQVSRRWRLLAHRDFETVGTGDALAMFRGTAPERDGAFRFYLAHWH